jgi:hypothetical protein
MRLRLVVEGCSFVTVELLAEPPGETGSAVGFSYAPAITQNVPIAI